MSNEIQRFDFQGDALEVVKQGADLFVGLRSVCEALGVNTEGQRKKLAEREWAVTEIISATAADGKQYGVTGVHLDTLPMWLATISPSKVAAPARPKLIAYQKQAARALADHFLPRATPTLPAAPTPPNQLAQELAAEAMEQAIRATVGAPAPFLPSKEKVYARGVEPQAGMPPHATSGGPVKRAQQGRCPYCAQPVWFAQLAPLSDRWVPLEVGHAESGWVELRTAHSHAPSIAGWGRVWLHHLPRCAAYWAAEAEKRREWEEAQIRAQAIADVRAEQLKEQQRARRR